MEREELFSQIAQAATEQWTTLDLSGQGLTDIPDAIAQLSIPFSSG